MSIVDPAELWDAVKRDYLEELQRGRYYLRNDLASPKLQECGSVDAYVTKIQNLLDQYKLGSNNKESIGAQQQVFCLFHGIPEGGDWDVELRLIQDKLETDDWYNQHTTIIKKLKNRESELRKAKASVRMCSCIPPWLRRVPRRTRRRESPIPRRITRGLSAPIARRKDTSRRRAGKSMETPNVRRINIKGSATRARRVTRPQRIWQRVLAISAG
jgi:hypothetical protein